MTNRIVLFAILLFVIIASGCASWSPPATTMISASESVPAGTESAVIWAIDGRRVSHKRDIHRLSPGRYLVSVLPRQDGPLSTTVAYGLSAQRRGIRIAALDIEVEAGQKIELAAVVRRHRTGSETDGAPDNVGPWQTTVLPLVVAAR